MDDPVPSLFAFGETMLRLAVAGGERLETAESMDVSVGGAESNVAAAAQSLGIDATWCSTLPESPLGRRIYRELAATGLTLHVNWDEEGRAGTYFIEQAGVPRGSTVVYDRQEASVTTMSPAEVPLDTLDAWDAVFTTGITPALSETLRETTTAVLTAAHESTPMTVFDTNYRSKLWDAATARDVYRRLFPLLDVLVVAERDAASVLGRDGEPGTVARDLREAYDLEIAIVTAGVDGAVAAHDGGLVEQDVVDAETVDPIGTGDAFLGGFLAWYLRGETVEEAMSAAAATAALKRTITGDMAVLTRAEVIAVMEDAGRAIDR